MSSDFAIARAAEDVPASKAVEIEVLPAITRLLSVAADLGGPEAVGARLVHESRELFGVTRAVLISADVADGTVGVVTASPVEEKGAGALPIERFGALVEVTSRDAGPVLIEGDAAADLDLALGARPPAAILLAVPMRCAGEVLHVLLLSDTGPRAFSDKDIEGASALAAAAAASLAQMQLADDHAGQVAQQAALARAAKTLNESLDLNRVLVRICHEAAGILDAESAIVFRGDAKEGLTAEAAYGMPPEALGYRMSPGTGLVGRVAERDEALISNDYQRLSPQPDPTLFGQMHSAVAVPMHWSGSLRGVLAVYYKRQHLVTPENMGLLEAFGELAAAACRNASVHAGLAEAARTDGLTGCLNHAAMHDALKREIERCERTGHRLALVLLDMDDFKQVNEEHGHLMGDEVLRRVGQALRYAVRPYDHVARYGGDEFAILAVESDEPDACDLADRALEGVRKSLEGMQESQAAGSASAGVAEWSPGEISTELIERADRALLYGKQHRDSGSVVAGSELPDDYRPSQQVRGHPHTPTPEAAVASPSGWPVPSGSEQTDRLRKRSHQLALANQLGARLAAMTEPAAILESAVDELSHAFGYTACAVIRERGDGFVDCAAGCGAASTQTRAEPWSRPRGAGLIGRCLRERRPVSAANASEVTSFRGDGPSTDVRAELVVPLWVGEDLWGAVAVQEARSRAFDEDDGRLVQAVADQIGSALRSAMLYERLEGAYLGTAEALAGALETKDSYTPGHSRTVVGRTQQVGARLGMSESELRTLHFAALFHDIGKIAVPESILNKSGPLTPAERREIERHTLVGERILSTVDFLQDVLPLIRHEHERWDGNGYPDALKGEQIPLGSRVILACDAYSAMTSDRPYRPAMTDSEAGAELLAGAGTQFDERVVAALLQGLESRAPSQAAVKSPK